MALTYRKPTPADADDVARLVFEAFASIHDRHQFPRDFPTIESAKGFAQAWLNHPKIWGVLAEREGRIIACNFLDERNVVPGVGPICVDPKEQSGGIGRAVMTAVVDRSRDIGSKSVRLCQDAFNTSSMSLYASLGFVINEPLVLVRGKLLDKPSSGATVRPMSENDLPGCATLCRRVHGFDRNAELSDALKMFVPYVLERRGQIAAYMSASVFWAMNHAVAETGQDMRDLLAGASSQIDEPISFLLPTRNAEFFRWALAQKLRVLKPMSLMTLGDYREPSGWWLPSVEY